MTGIASYSLKSLPDRAYIRAGTEAKILAIPLVACARAEGDAGGYVPALGSARRIQALIAIGYTKYRIAELTDMHIKTITDIALGYTKVVQAESAKTIADIFNRYHLVIPPRDRWTTAARRGALAKGWAIPLAWDEHTIDDPNAQPDIGESNKLDWYEEYKELIGFGLSHDKAAERMNLNRDSLYQRILRLNNAKMAG